MNTESSQVRQLGRSAFTLIELLVVVAIIAVLMAVLLPSLQSAREQANSVKCLANQKSLFLAQSAYAAEYNSRMLVAKYSALPLPDGTMQSQTWLMYLNTAGYIPGGGKKGTNGFYTFARRSAGVCPGWGFFDSISSTQLSWQWQFQGTYGTNGHLAIGAPNDVFLRPSLVSQPSEVLFIADKAAIITGTAAGRVAITYPQDSQASGSPTAIGSPPGADPDYQLGPWHRNGFPIVYLDGHGSVLAKVPSAGGWNTSLYHPPLPWTAGDLAQNP